MDSPKPIFLAAAAYCRNPRPSLAEGLRDCLSRVACPPERPSRVYLASILEDMAAKQVRFQTARQTAKAPGDFLVPLIHSAWGIRPRVVRVNTACTSGATALALAAHAIRFENQPCGVVIGYEEKSLFDASGFQVLQTLSRRKTMLPFTRGRDGFTLASAAGVAILSSSPRRGAIRLGGFAVTNDAHHPTGPHREGEGLQRCIRTCLACAGKEPAEVACLKLNGSGTPYSDAAEYQALKAIFGERLPAIPCYALKPRLGHLQGAAGLVETILAARHLARGQVPAMPAALIDDLEFELSLSARTRRLPLANCLLLYSGFGGQNACLLLERVR